MSMAERKTMTRAVKNPVKRKLTRAEKKEIAAVIQAAKGDGKPHTAQQTILCFSSFFSFRCAMYLLMAALNILPVNFVPLTTSVKVLFSTSSCIFSPPFHEVCRESLFLLRRNHQPPQKITLHTALLSVTGQNGHSADCPGVPLRGSKS